MPHVPPLVATVALGLVLAFSLGVLAHRFKLPPLIGYLVAGILIGPFTPGPVADQDIANQLAEIGVILLMFGVGLHFSPQDLLSVRGIAVTGALAQALIATPLGMAVGWWLGWSLGAGIIFGIALSIASTVVLLRVLQERRLLETERGRITVGWLIVQDIAMVLVLVLVPALAALFHEMETAPGFTEIMVSVTLLLAKLGIFLAVMLVVGKKLIPAILHYVAHTGSRELFRLAVLAIALGIAYAATELFGVSLALGAFFAGMMLSESRLSQQAATESLPLRDAFAVLFFVSVGMLFDPAIIASAPLALLATVLIILVGKSAAAFLVVRLFGHSRSAALMITASLAQIGEFSFILANRSLELELLPAEGRDLILAGAIITILLNPLLFAVLDVYAARREKGLAEAAADQREEETKMREPIQSHLARRSCGAGRPWPGWRLHRRGVEGAKRSVSRHRGRRRQGRRPERAWHRGGRRQCRRSGGDPSGELAPRALPSRGDSRRVRGRPGGAAGPRHQSQSPHHCPGAFRGRDRPSQAARRQYRGDGRA